MEINQNKWFYIISILRISNSVIEIYNAKFIIKLTQEFFTVSQCLTISQCTMQSINNQIQIIQIIPIQIMQLHKQLVITQYQKDLKILAISYCFQTCFHILI
ncbi:unnamed protein product [Paramecium sonneborni]|uniref:Uncharacterized protein n=1 Tax=Paramecium sonneborni TaxID=65129 RepID=A0A8S1RKF8_9CILI|nr:unnamed protein product [Paramecium sonneborni]